MSKLNNVAVVARPITVTKYYVKIGDVERPFDQVWDILEDVNPNAITLYESEIEDEKLREALEDVGAIEVDSSDMCRAGEDYDTFCAAISEMREIALDSDPMVLPTHELKPTMPGDPKFGHFELLQESGLDSDIPYIAPE